MGVFIAPTSEFDAHRYVFVVDDEDDIRSSIEEILQTEGYATMGARNGAEALSLLARQTELPRLILLDLMMPVMDGWEFLARIDDDSRLHRIPVALMSAHDSVKRAFDKHRDEERSLRLLFPKPLSLFRLIATVRFFCSDDPALLEHGWEVMDDDTWSLREAPTAKFHPLRP